jgi:hypothetical protein
MRRIGFPVALILVGACGLAPSPPPVPVQGQDEEISAFSGEWSGRYSSKATGRHGTIRFNLPENADTGYGEVEITFSPSLEMTRQAAAADYPKAHPEELSQEPCTSIGIRVVRIEDNLVRGTMAPYWDPDCECRANTVFEGKLEGNQVKGSFSTRRESKRQPLAVGEWRAERSKP